EAAAGSPCEEGATIPTTLYFHPLVLPRILWWFGNTHRSISNPTQGRRNQAVATSEPSYRQIDREWPGNM
ncbi:unnamed protein product, partial [Urochloa humidicola]